MPESASVARITAKGLLTPIEGDNPSGQNLRFDPVYAQIKEARRADDGASQGDWQRTQKTASFSQVDALASEALTRSKDLQIAAWLTEAWINLQGLNGLTDGLTLLRLLLENFWDTLYPEIDDGDLETRAAPLEWVGAKLTVPVKYIPMTRSGLNFIKYEESRHVGYEQDATSELKQQARADALAAKMVTAEAFDEEKDNTPVEFYDRLIERLRAPQEALDELDNVCKKSFGDDYSPNLIPLRQTLTSISETAEMFVRQKRPDAVETPGQGFLEQLDDSSDTAAPAPVAVSGGAAAAPARKVVSSAAGRAVLPQSREDAIYRIVEAANYLRTENPYSVAPYLVLRGLRWGELRDLGETPDSANLEPPPTEVRQRLRTLAKESEWQTLLEETEAAMGQPYGQGWLDLQRYTLQACGELSSSYDPLAKAIRSEMQALLADFPDLPGMTLADDTPAANADTRKWLEEIAKPPQQEQQAPEMTRIIEANEDAADAVQEVDPYDMALESASAGRHEEAISILAREAGQERSGRGRFLRKVQLAQICLAAGRESLAQPILLSIAHEIESRKLDDWEAPEVLSRPLALLLRCLNKLKAEPEEKQRIYARICNLDPVQALEFAK